MHENFIIHGAIHLDKNNSYENKELYPDFQDKIEKFKQTIISSVNLNQKLLTFRLGDGDYFFYKKIPTGVAKPGNYGYKNKKYLKNNEKFVKNIDKFNLFQSLLNSDHPKRFFDYFKREMDYPVEFTYGLIANKWIFGIPNIKIGLIGAKDKIVLIKELMRSQEYQEYIGIKNFEDFIEVPQNFLVDKAEKTLKKIKTEIAKNGKEVSMYIYGLGYAKSYIIPEISKLYENKIFLDAGVSIDALAGVVNLERPYFWGWTNYHLKNQPKLYKKVDYLFRDGTLGEIKYI